MPGGGNPAGFIFFEKTSFLLLSQGYLSEGRKIPRKER